MSSYVTTINTVDSDNDDQPNDIVPIYVGGAESKVKNILVGNKAKVAIRNRQIEWDTFKEHLALLGNRNDNKEQMLREFVDRFFAIQGNEETKLSEVLCNYISQDLIQFVQHMRKMLFLHEPLAWAIREVFFSIVHIYEAVLKKLISESLWDMFIDKWKQHNPEDTSSLALWNLGKDHTFEKAIIAAQPTLAPLFTRVLNDSAQWSYKGFCPKVPGVRLGLLLKFPIWELLASVSSDMKSQIMHTVDIDKINKGICNVIHESSLHTELFNITSIVDKCTRMDPPNKKEQRHPENIIDLILKYEKELQPALDNLEKHYIEKAKLFGKIALAISNWQ